MLTCYLETGFFGVILIGFAIFILIGFVKFLMAAKEFLSDQIHDLQFAYKNKRVKNKAIKSTKNIGEGILILVATLGIATLIIFACVGITAGIGWILVHLGIVGSC